MRAHKMLQITSNTPPKEISEEIKILREKKGKEKETLILIDKALAYGHDFVINLFWEKALTYQHIFMNDRTDMAPLSKMEETVLTARFYIEKYHLTKWYSRLYRFLGRISDYKGEFSKSISFYKKSIKFANDDPEPYRTLEIQGFLSYTLMMSGKVDVGYKLARKTFEKFSSSLEGKNLKSSDYQTWAIWRSGIVIRTIGVFMSKKLNFDRADFLRWLEQIEGELSGGDFSYRKDEIRELKLKLQED